MHCNGFGFYKSIIWINFRDMVTYERETGDVLERFNETLNVVRSCSQMVAHRKPFKALNVVRSSSKMVAHR